MKFIKLFYLFALVLLLLESSEAKAKYCMTVNQESERVLRLHEGSLDVGNCFRVETGSHTEELSVVIQDTDDSGFHLVRVKDDGSKDQWSSYKSLAPLFKTSDNIAENYLVFDINALAFLGDKEFTIVNTVLEGQHYLFVISKSLPGTPIEPDPILDPPCVNYPFCKPIPIVLQSNGLNGVLSSSGSSSFYGNTPPGGSQNCDANNTPPTAPNQVDLNDNIREAEEYARFVQSSFMQMDANPTELKSLRFAWAFAIFNDGARFDFKRRYGSQYENFGNFHYGAFMRAAGFSRGEILGGAAANQAGNDGLGFLAMIEAYVFEGPDGPGDQSQIENGMNYYSEVYSNDPNNAQVSDSCDANNGQNNSAGFGLGPAFNGNLTTFDFEFSYSCEVWQLPDGNNGYYYIQKNCEYRFGP